MAHCPLYRTDSNLNIDVVFSDWKTLELLTNVMLSTGVFPTIATWEINRTVLSYTCCDRSKLRGKLRNFTHLAKNSVQSFLTICRQVTDFTSSTCYALSQCVKDPIFLCYYNTPPPPRAGMATMQLYQKNKLKFWRGGDGDWSLKIHLSKERYIISQ